MRPIDADALLERYGEPCHSFADVIEDMPTLDLAPKWISVKDRLPEDDVMVLVCSNNGDGSHTIAITYHTHKMYGYSIVGWIEPWQYFFYNHEITHWMPLPEVPKEE